MERDGLIVYKVWFDSIKLMTEDVDTLKECALAILEYGFYGKEYTGDNSTIKVVMMNAMPQIDANIRKLNKAKARRGCKSNATKRPKVENDKANVKVKIKEKEKEKEILKEKESSVQEKDGDTTVSPEQKMTRREKAEENAHIRFADRAKELVQDDSDIGQFNKWLIKNARFIVGHYKHLVTEEELSKLMTKYSSGLICNTILNLENDRKRRWTYVNLYLTLSRNWLPYELERWQRQQLTQTRLISQVTKHSNTR